MQLLIALAVPLICAPFVEEVEGGHVILAGAAVFTVAGSFIILSTVGYSDITPVSRVARWLAVGRAGSLWRVGRIPRGDDGVLRGDGSHDPVFYM